MQSRMAYSREFVVDSSGGHGTMLCAVKVCKDVCVHCGTTVYYSSRCKYDISTCGQQEMSVDMIVWLAY